MDHFIISAWEKKERKRENFLFYARFVWTDATDAADACPALPPSLPADLAKEGREGGREAALFSSSIHPSEPELPLYFGTEWMFAANHKFLFGSEIPSIEISVLS